MRRSPTSTADRVRERVVAGIARTLPWVITRSLRRGLTGIYVRGETAALQPGTILAFNHHSWWDAYLCWYVARKAQLPLAVLMDDAQLQRFPFFRHQGAIAASRPREMARRTQSGALGVIFPEAAVQPPGRLRDLAPGAIRIAAWSKAPLHTVALRVASRGFPRPEAFLTFGPRVSSEDELAEGLQRDLAALDASIADADPEAEPEGFDVWLRGASSPERRSRRFERLWTGSE